MTKRKQKKAAPTKVPLIILSNDRNEGQSRLLQMFYNATQLGQIGLISGMDPETGNVSPMLAGIEYVDGEIKGVYPLARILESTEEIERILIPDGKGNYVSNNSGFSELDDSCSYGETEEEGGSSLEQGPSEAS